MYSHAEMLFKFYFVIENPEILENVQIKWGGGGGGIYFISACCQGNSYIK